MALGREEKNQVITAGARAGLLTDKPRRPGPILTLVYANTGILHQAFDGTLSTRDDT